MVSPLVIEPINEEEHSFISTVSTAMDAVMAVNRPNLMTMIDSYHFTKQKDDPDTVIRNISHIGHIHYAAQARRSYPLESDMDDCRQLLTPLLMPDIKAVSALKLTLIIQSRICRKAPGC